MNQDKAGDTKALENQPVHIKKSFYALEFLNNEIHRYVTLKNNVSYLKAMETRVTLTHNDSLWKQVHKALTDKADELKDCLMSLQTSKEIYDLFVKEEAEGKYL